MMDKSSEALNERRLGVEFIEKLAALIIEYRTEIPVGHIVGALETSKFRLLVEANEAAMEEYQRIKKGTA